MWYFLDAIVRSVVWALRRTRRINPFESAVSAIRSEDNLGRQIKDDGEAVAPFHGHPVRGRRNQRTLGPVMLAPGFGMSTFAFHAAGDDSFAEYLHREGYDVWLFDYRASDKLDASLEQFDIDVLATVRTSPTRSRRSTASQRKRVRVVAHCLASLTMQMSLLSGKIETNSYVRSMLLSQSFAFIDLPWSHASRCGSVFPEILTYLNFRPVVTSDYDIRVEHAEPAARSTAVLFSQQRAMPRRRVPALAAVLRRSGPPRPARRRDARDCSTICSIAETSRRSSTSARCSPADASSTRKGKNVYLKPEHAPRVNVPITLLSGHRESDVPSLRGAEDARMAGRARTVRGSQ